MKLKEITLHLENCDHITIDGKYIGDFHVDKIKTSISRIASNAICKMEVANVFAIEIHKDADKIYNEHGMDRYVTTVFKRLNQRRDITQIDFTLVENHPEKGQEPKTEHYEYYVRWCGEDYNENDAQINYVSDVGHLYIVIEKNGKIDDYFNKEEINDMEWMDCKFDMYHVGDNNS